MADDFLAMWTIYRHPADVPPGMWTVRRWLATREGLLPEYGPPYPLASVEEARERIPPWAYASPLREEDPSIFEVWF